MTPDFWIERWQNGEIGFHQQAGNDLLPKHWPSLQAPSRSTVFVPLCGKSFDMVWLASQGHHVVGVELSPLAVDRVYASLETLMGSGATIVLVEQDLKRALKVATRVICMLEGRIVMEGRAAEITREQVMDAYFGLHRAAHAAAGSAAR